jgi:NLI interacting factor-like phosphatase
MLRIAFDLDETLGVPLLENQQMVGFQLRTGCAELLTSLQPVHTLILWSVSSRRYVEKALASGLSTFFKEVYTWEEIPSSWKDVRVLQVDYLIDDSEHHFRQSQKIGISEHYILVPAYGSPDDIADPMSWIERVKPSYSHD